MKTIELIKKLAELGRLVEIWKEPTDEALEYFGWKCTETTSCHTPLYIKVNHHTLISNEIVLNDFEKAWNHEITQASFKAEVRKVAGELKDLLNESYIDFKLEHNKECLEDMREWGFEALFKDVLLQYVNEDRASFAVITICHKLGVELESEGA